MSGSGIYRAPKSGEQFSSSWRGEGDSRDWLGGWGVLRDGLLSPFLTYGAQRKLCVCLCVSEGEEWAHSTGAASLQPTTNTQSLSVQSSSRQVQVCSVVKV